MKVQIANDIVIAFGNELFGDDIFDAPDDYFPEKYDYAPSIAGVFDPNGFVLIILDDL